MLGTPSSEKEKQLHISYLKKLIKEAWLIIDHQDKGWIDRKEVSYLMKYLLQYPSEAQVRDYIIEQLEEDNPSDFVKYEKFEAYMVPVLMSNEFEPSPPEHLMAAFRCLDPEGKGYVRKDIAMNLLNSKGIAFRLKESKEFQNFALDKTGQFILYEEYIDKITKENEL